MGDSWKRTRVALAAERGLLFFLPLEWLGLVTLRALESSNEIIMATRSEPIRVFPWCPLSAGLLFCILYILSHQGFLLLSRLGNHYCPKAVHTFCSRIWLLHRFLSLGIVSCSYASRQQGWWPAMGPLSACGYVWNVQIPVWSLIGIDGACAGDLLRLSSARLWLWLWV